MWEKKRGETREKQRMMPTPLPFSRPELAARCSFSGRVSYATFDTRAAAAATNDRQTMDDSVRWDSEAPHPPVKIHARGNRRHFCRLTPGLLATADGRTNGHLHCPLGGTKPPKSISRVSSPHSASHSSIGPVVSWKRRVSSDTRVTPTMLTLPAHWESCYE